MEDKDSFLRNRKGGIGEGTRERLGADGGAGEM